MKINRTKKLMAVMLLLSSFLFYKFRPKTDADTTANSKKYLTVSDAKVKAWQLQAPEAVVNLKGIYTVQQNTSKGILLQLEDAEPTGMEEVPLYCRFTSDNQFWLKEIVPGTELVISGMISRNNNSVQVTDCKIICINKGTVEPLELTFTY
jgi:hypothetical protein